MQENPYKDEVYLSDLDPEKRERMENILNLCGRLRLYHEKLYNTRLPNSYEMLYKELAFMAVRNQGEPGFAFMLDAIEAQPRAKLNEYGDKGQVMLVYLP